MEDMNMPLRKCCVIKFLVNEGAYMLTFTDIYHDVGYLILYTLPGVRIFFLKVTKSLPCSCYEC
jgi:hypothetical protein